MDGDNQSKIKLMMLGVVQRLNQIMDGVIKIIVVGVNLLKTNLIMAGVNQLKIIQIMDGVRVEN